MSNVVVLKLSGETLGSSGQGFESSKIDLIVREVIVLCEVCQNRDGGGVVIVVGGGNFARFSDLEVKLPGIHPIVLHQIGMLTTVMNAMAISSLLNHCLMLKGRRNRSTVVSTVPVAGMVDGWDVAEAKEWLREKDGGILFVAGGTGFPGIATTDTAAVMVAVQLGAKLVLKGTKVDGIYSSDPSTDPSAKMFGNITATQFLTHKFDGILDPVAVAMARKEGIEIRVFRFTPLSGENPSLCSRMIKVFEVGKEVGTLVVPE